MELDFHTTAAFTGHRTYGGEADAALRATVRRLYARGFRTFLCGMAVGFDLAAAEAVLACRDGAAGERPASQSGSNTLCGDASQPGNSLSGNSLSGTSQPGNTFPSADTFPSATSQTGASQPGASLPVTFPPGAYAPPGAAFLAGGASDGKASMSGSSAPTGNAPVCGAAVPDENPAFSVNGFRVACPSSVNTFRMGAFFPSGNFPDAADAPLSGLRLVAVVPFRGQEARFSQADRARYRAAVAAADAVVTLAPAYNAGCYAVRNNYLVDHASLLVAWYDGSPGGTRYTVSRALRRGLEFVNLHPQRAAAPSPEPTLF